TRAYQLQPDNQEVIKALSTLYFNNRQFEKAIAMAQKCKSCGNADRILGMSYYNTEDYGRATQFLTRAVSENASDSESAYTLGRTYLELDNEKAAITQYQHSITVAPDRYEWIYELGLIYYDQNDFQNSQKYIQLAGQRGYFKTNDYYENLGFTMLYNGYKKEGLDTLNLVLEHKPNNKDLLNNIAYALYETKQYDDALNYYAKLLTLDSKDASALYMAGIVFQKKGEKAKGEKLCDKAIAMDPSLARNRQRRQVSMGL
ncbi:MAG: tetratricopeptide repeat protein, partial [Bacteroidota bacterium]|nr:tetratricopeptide repeat protein [Bacteroidota bacterium]